MKTVRTRLRITDHGNARAEQVRLELSPLGEGAPPHLHDRGITPDIPPQAFYDWPVMISMGSSPGYRVHMHWKQAGEDFVETQDL